MKSLVPLVLRATIPILVCGSYLESAGQQQQLSIIPEPRSLVRAPGSYSIGPDSAVLADAELLDTASYLAERLRRSTGFELPVQEQAPDPVSGAITLRLDAKASATSRQEREAYRLLIDEGRVHIAAPAPAGVFYGVQTLLQMFPPSIYSEDPPRLHADQLVLTGVHIEDRPRFEWRGLMIDVSRHFFSKQQILKTIDAMAVHKLNVLHLHLTDDPGWRIEIDGYPRFVNIGSVGDMSNPEGPERLYFSKEDIREIVAHAGRHHIIVVPEIDMPGHSLAAAKAYPEFYDGHKTLNPANEGTYEFVENILSEVMELFPAGYLHFGGDEVRDHRWAELPEMEDFMQRNGYAEWDEVEEHFDRFVSRYIVERGYTPIGWDEIASFDVHPDTIVQWWLHLRPEARDRAIEKGHRVIISPNNYLYFDYPNGLGEPGAPWEGNDNGPNSVELIHQWEPIPESYSAEEEALVLGLQANLWTEFIETNDYYEYMVFPRLSALAEIAWRPKGRKDLDDFIRRLAVQSERYEAMALNYRVYRQWLTDYSYLRH